MADQDPQVRRSDKPMYGECRPSVPALVGVVSLVVVVVVLFLLITFIS